MFFTTQSKSLVWNTEWVGVLGTVSVLVALTWICMRVLTTSRGKQIVTDIREADYELILRTHPAVFSGLFCSIVFESLDAASPR